MDDRAREFFKNLLHQAIHAGVWQMMWRLPTLWLVIALGLMIAAVVYWQLY